MTEYISTGRASMLRRNNRDNSKVQESRSRRRLRRGHQRAGALEKFLHAVAVCTMVWDQINKLVLQLLRNARWGLMQRGADVANSVDVQRIDASPARRSSPYRPSPHQRSVRMLGNDSAS
jgi:hypothetical protein